MRPDPLQSMLRIRQSALEDAQKALARAYLLERDASRRVSKAIETLDLEMRAATSLAAGDDAVETFARWLPTGRRQVGDAQRAQRDATVTLDHLRAVLALARAGVKSVETVIDQKKQQNDAAQTRRDQHAMDEQTLTRQVRQDRRVT